VGERSKGVDSYSLRESLVFRIVPLADDLAFLQDDHCKAARCFSFFYRLLDRTKPSYQPVKTIHKWYTTVPTVKRAKRRFVEGHLILLMNTRKLHEQFALTNDPRLVLLGIRTRRISWDLVLGSRTRRNLKRAIFRHRITVQGYKFSSCSHTFRSGIQIHVRSRIYSFRIGEPLAIAPTAAARSNLQLEG